MRNKLHILSFAILIISLNSYSQAFTEITSTITGYSTGKTDWGDYDNDGDLDILICGRDDAGIPASKVFRNNGNSTFTEQTGIVLIGLKNGDCDWQDYDGDGNLDILLTGRDQGNVPLSVIYKNNGSNSFARQTSIVITGLYQSSADWGDYDNDGDFDILITGWDQSAIATSKIYRNNGNNTFSEQTAIVLTAVSHGECSWADYDNDGDLDILITGYNPGLGSVSHIFMNNGNNSFTQQTGISLTGLYYSSVDWGNYNDDRYLDILITGYNSATGQSISKVFKNNGNNTFTEQTDIILPGIYRGSAEWGDYDNDGDLDIVLSGDSGSAISELFRNDGNNVFTNVNTGLLTGVFSGDIRWGDFDNDLDLDLILTGFNGTNRVTGIYRNNSTVSNTPPTIPKSLNVTMNGNEYTFSWNNSNDNETSYSGIEYNIRIGTSSGSGDIKSAESISGTGYNKLINQGNVGHRFTWTIKNLPPGNYFWSVQAIDHGYLASEFAAEKRLETYFSESGFQYSGSGMPFLGDYDRDGDIDILADNATGTTFFRNDLSQGSGFTDINVGIPYTYAGDYPFALGDYDNDGDIDIAHSERGLESNFITVIYRNDNGTFVDINAEMEGIWMGKMEWGDYDNDGDLDLFLYGNHENSDDGEPLGILNRNEGNDVFINTDIYIEDARRGALALADYNKDGYLDILTCGYNLSQNIFTSVLKNINGTSFTNINAGIEGYSYGDLDWGDYDNDGYLDIFITGGLYGGDGSTRIYHNEGDDSFTDIGVNFPGDYSYTTISEWGDYDNDGDLDVLSSSNECIIRNDGNNIFTVLNIGVDLSSGRWGDIDNDGDLDIVDGSNIYINNITIQNSEPEIPLGLESTISGDQARLTWDISSDDITPDNGISYNVCVGTSPGNWDILSPMTANSPEYSKAIPGMGNAFTNTFKIIKDLPTGTYYWTVQSVDNGFMSSDFAAVQSFDIYPMFTNILPITVYENALWGDYNNDGATDILSSDYSAHYFYRNDGNDTFTQLNAGISGDNEFLSLGDFDNDGDLDIISTDSLFYNQSGNVFTNSGIYFEFINYSYQIGDFDADGDIDILSDNEYIYRNDGNNTFTPIQLDLTDSWIGTFDWFDYDNDGDLDIILIHGVYLNYTTDIFRNDGNATFTNINANLVGMFYGSISYYDFDNDNDLDLYLGGSDNNHNNRTIIYRNNGDDTFTDINTLIRGYHDPNSFWGDFNNDGYSDFIISGYNNGRERNKLYQNNHDDTFTELGIENIIEYITILDCADYDNDGDIDAITNQGVFRNNTNHSNDIPPVLSNLDYDLLGLDCRLSWNRANDPNEPSYSYNIKIGTTPGGLDIKTPVSTPGPGNVPTDTSWIVRNLTTGLYYWSVQAVNANYKAGPWAPVESFLITDVSPDFTYDTVCFGETTSFTDLSVTTDVLVGWNWDFGDGNTSNVRHPTHMYETAGTFDVSLKVFSQSGDSAVRVRQVMVKFAPDALFSVSPVCKDESSILVNQSTVDGITIDTWQWDFGNGEYSDVQGTVQKIYVSTDTAILTIIAENGCWDADTQIVRIAEYPDATLSLSPGYSNIFCDGDSTILVAPYNDTYNYQWQLNGANILNASDTSLIIKGPGGKYSIQIENPIATCVSSDSVQVSVYSAPSSPNISSDGPVQFCEGDSVKLSVSDNPDYSYQWYLNGGGVGVNSSELIVKNSGDYTVSVINSTGCEANSSNSIVVTVDPVPVVPTVSINGNTTFCQGNSVELSTTNNPDYSYQWTRNSISILGENTNSYTAVNSGTYALTIINANVCTSKTDDVVVTVVSSPVAPGIEVSGTTDFCEGDSVTLSVVYYSDYTYQWKLNGGAMGDNSNELIAKTGGDYTVTVINSGGCEANSTNNIVVDVDPIPVVPTVSINGSTTFCQGNSVELSVPNNPEYTYQWTNNSISISGENTNSYTAVNSGLYALSITNSSGCASKTEDVIVTVIPSPTIPGIAINGTNVFCEGDSAILSGPDNPDFTYQWKLNGGAVGSNSYEYTAKYQGNITLDITNSGGCSVSSSNSIDIIVNSTPEVSAVNLSGPTEFCQGGNLMMSVVENLSYTYQWRNEYGILGGETTNSYTTSETGTYTLDISNSTGCTAQTIPVNVTAKPVPVSPTLEYDNYVPGECLGTDPVRLYPDYTQVGYNYQWLRNGIPIAYATNDYLEGFLSEGNYSLSVDLDGCTDESGILSIEFEDAPEKPDLYVKGPVVWYMAASDTAASQYKWYLNNEIINGADEYLYVANKQLGTYKVAIGNEQGCFTMSDEVAIPTAKSKMTDFFVPEELRIDEDVDPFANLKIYPNPSPGMFTVEMDNNIIGDLDIRIFTSEGRQILNIKFEKTTVHFQSQIDLSGQGEGMYLINFLLDTYFASRKIIID